ncbi:hypothetical protein BVC80_1651g77 [Macleaya cordata]|uniref:AB hydrolase-1 domain-containing protein n=1 Tax=Macleaya cordata TaxID=56857 RepID=A0A200PZC6_MACCD|nr:hypothetical protein BVC80_1651g77 [Macleaya cordata]
MFRKITVVLLVGILGWVYQAIKPPPPKICGSIDGPPVTSPRIRLSDGRYISYKESGVPKEKANYKIIIVHGFGDSKDFYLRASKELIEELGIYFLSFDRAGYGESDPNPKRSVKSEGFDIEELADQLEIGSKFYIIGVSMGGYPVWSCLKHIPNRIAGASLVVPIINYWWPSFPANLSKMVYKRLLLQDQWTYRVAHYVPQLLYWWLTQKWFPSLAAMEGNPEIFSIPDREMLKKIAEYPNPGQENVTQQGVFESLHRDLMVGFGTWDFDPMDLKNPFPENENSVQIWQGYQDRFIPLLLQRYVSERLPWIKYHEVLDGGHFMPYNTTVADAILRALLVGEEPSFI